MTLVAFEGVAVGTVMPVVGVELDGISIYAWAFNAYVVASLVGMVVAGTWCDRAGPRLPFVTGAIIFGGGALVAGFAPSMWALIAARGIQGLGGGAIVVAIYVLIGRAYDESLRPKAFSLLATSWVIPALVGPFIAGWLADSVSWRVAFWLVPVVMVVSLIVLRRVLAEQDGGTGEKGPSGRVVPAVGAAFGLTLVQAGLLRAGGMSVTMAVVMVIVGLAILIPSAMPLIPPHTLRLGRGLPTTIAMRGVLSGTFFAAEAFLPLALVQERGVSVTLAGLILGISALGWVTGSWIQSRIPGEGDRARVVQLGCGVVAFSLVTLPLCLMPGISPLVCGVSWLIGSIGMGLSFPSIAVQMMRLSPPEEQGVNSSALQICDAILSAIGLGIAGSIHAAAVSAGTVGSGTYDVIWLLAALGAAAGVLIAARMRPNAGHPRMEVLPSS